MMTDPAASQPGTHLDPDQMADLSEGLLESRAADVARAHLSSCRLCSSDFALITGEADLGELGGLGDLLPPAPIPEDVVIRIEAALHREPPLGTAAVPASHAARPRRRRLRIALGSLAGAALVVAGGVGVLSALNNGGGSTASTSSAAAGSAPSTQSDGAHASGRTPNGESPQLGAKNSPSSAPKFSGLSIETQAQQLLGPNAATSPAGTSQNATPACTPDTVTTDMKLLGSTETEYQGKQAFLFVYAQPGDTTRADVYVVDADSCTSGDTGHVVYQTVITRP